MVAAWKAPESADITRDLLRGHSDETDCTESCTPAPPTPMRKKPAASPPVVVAKAKMNEPHANSNALALDVRFGPSLSRRMPTGRRAPWFAHEPAVNTRERACSCESHVGVSSRSGGRRGEDGADGGMGGGASHASVVPSRRRIRRIAGQP